MKTEGWAKFVRLGSTNVMLHHRVGNMWVGRNNVFPIVIEIVPNRRLKHMRNDKNRVITRDFFEIQRLTSTHKIDTSALRRSIMRELGIE